MVYVVAFLIFVAITAVIWAVAVGLSHTFLGGPDLKEHPDFLLFSALTVGLVSFLSFIPFPAGYLVSLPVWWLAARNLFELPTGRALLLFVLLAGFSFVARLAVFGFLTS